MAVLVSSIDKNRNCNEAHSMDKLKHCILYTGMIFIDDNLGNKYLTSNSK